MQARNVVYAAVGAPVVVVRKVTDQMSQLKGRMSEESSNYAQAANKAIDGWATEGEKLVSGIREGKVVEEISQKVDFDQAKEQVSKLRDQLEDMLDTWRHSFRPETAGESAPADKTAAKTSKAKSTTTAKSTSTSKKPAAKSSAAKTTAAKGGGSSTAAKKSSAKSTSNSQGSKARAS